jgi:DNA polymerase V
MQQKENKKKTKYHPENVFHRIFASTFPSYYLIIMLTPTLIILFPSLFPSQLPLPLFSAKVAAGFPSPADDYVEKNLDLNELLIQTPAATFFVRAQGESMLGAGIHPNDILIVDRSLEAVAGKIVICALNGELTVKRLQGVNGQWQLKAENPAYADLIIHDDLDMVIWGVVTNVIHAL